MSLDPKTIYFTQRTADGSNWQEVYISGSNLFIQTDADGILTGSNTLPPAINALSASYAVTASYVIAGAFSGSIESSSYAGYAAYAASSSHALTASYLIGQSSTSSYALKAESLVNGININAGTVTASAMLVQSLHVVSITSSIVTATGSNKFGDDFSDKQQFTGSVSITGSLELSGNLIGTLEGTASYAITSSATLLNNTIVSNQTVGGISSSTTLTAGRTIESILRQMLISYIPPTISSLTMRLNGSTVSMSTRDVNNSFTVNSASFTAALDSPDGNSPVSSSWTASGADIGTVNYYFGNNVLSSGNNVLSVGSTYTINRASSAGSVTFTVNAKRLDTNAFITGTSTSVYFGFRNYFCASSTAIVSDVTAQSVINSGVVTSALDTDKVWTATCSAANDTAGNYTYIIYPASYGDLSGVVQNNALPVLTAFTKLGDYTITNGYGASVSVRVYQSNSTQAFASGTVLSIS